jgi:hypothetical protein
MGVGYLNPDTDAEPPRDVRRLRWPDHPLAASTRVTAPVPRPMSSTLADVPKALLSGPITEGSDWHPQSAGSGST